MARPLEFDRNEILGQALQIFWTNGYKNTSMEKLVSGLGVNRASVYNTFGNKREFFAAALDHYLNTRLPDLLQVLRSDQSAEVRLSGFFQRLIELGGKGNHYRGCFVIGSMSELSLLEPELAKLCHETIESLEKELSKVVKQGQASGEIRSDLNPKDVTTILVSSAIGLMAKARSKENPARLMDAVNASITLIRNPTNRAKRFPKEAPRPRSSV